MDIFMATAGMDLFRIQKYRSTPERLEQLVYFQFKQHYLIQLTEIW